jgi:hypothetical protein
MLGFISALFAFLRNSSAVSGPTQSTTLHTPTTVPVRLAMRPIWPRTEVRAPRISPRLLPVQDHVDQKAAKEQGTEGFIHMLGFGSAWAICRYEARLNRFFAASPQPFNSVRSAKRQPPSISEFAYR